MTIIIADNRNNSPKEVRQLKGEKKPFTVNYSRLEKQLNDSVSGVAWSADGSATISNEALASSVATAEITTGNTGWHLIKVTAILSNSTHISYFKIKVNDPKGSAGDYC